MIDFPRAWEITRTSNDAEHDDKCSWIQARMLCDCRVIYQHPEYLDNYLKGGGHGMESK